MENKTNESLPPTKRLRTMSSLLLSWYKDHARTLPWREDPGPYQVWISEIMLQQTRIEAVKPYFSRFMEAFPDVPTLALADEDRLLKLWEGLGYYNRARNLKKAAQVMTELHDGQLPPSYEELLKLPGIGTYTAGAIASIAFGIPVPAVDGNVLRVISRVLASLDDVGKPAVKKQMESLLKEIMPRDDAGAFNQGLMEIGETICVPNGPPRCPECPLSPICLARIHNSQASIPVKAPKKPRRVENRTVLLILSGTDIAIEKRPDTGLLASLYQFPNLEGHLNRQEIHDFLESLGASPERIEPAGEARHVFSHVEWHMTGYLARLKGKIPSTYLAVGQEELRRKYPIPNAFSAYIKLLNRQL